MLSKAIDVGEFGRAHLLYNVLIPKIHESRRSNRPRYAQVDFLLITQRAVYVIEAKNLNGNIECLYRKKQREYQVFVNRCTRNDVPLATPQIEDHGPSQNKEHRRCLLERCISISPDETISIVAYVKKHLFYAPSIHPQRMSHITTLDKGALGIVRLIKAIEEVRPVLRSPSEMDDLARRIESLFSDADGEAAQTHAMGIARIKQIDALYR